ncbi:hypothetical protein Athai_61870 [Actinocatenispora thailandica]|uniref:Uncharacterized protein n=1 Tax=Actinocatenispora thailandica TaxID=227318 RepID=A0A7R7DVK6_9ACTN|nr:hypothetical protein [Actinocatenispora thailandica]BCJ38684.1 hypothetical protein Athai_61870 [Actinocatenispora thailandica]
MIGRLRAIGAFWYDFVVGDDWRIAVAVVAALGATYGVSRLVPAWWLLPAAVGLVLPWSLVRARRRPRGSGSAAVRRRG